MPPLFVRYTRRKPRESPGRRRRRWTIFVLDFKIEDICPGSGERYIIAACPRLLAMVPNAVPATLVTDEDVISILNVSLTVPGLTDRLALAVSPDT